MADMHTELGSPDDRVHLEINGQRLPNCVQYSVKRSILTQPSSFSLVLGAGRPNVDAFTAGELLRLAQPRTAFTMMIGSTTIMSGLIEDRDVADNNGTTVTVSGRDWMIPLVKEYIHYEVDFGQPTYFELVRKVLDICGLKDRKLYADNEANRKTSSRSVKAKAQPMADLVESFPTNTQLNANSKVNVQRIVGKVGGTWFDFIRKQLKKSGLYLWATADGNFVLSRPTGTLDPQYKVIYKRGVPRTMTQTSSRQFSDHTSTRWAHSVCFGKGANGAKGVHKMERNWPDFEMGQYGYTDTFVQYESDAKTPNEAEYAAKRKTADARRDSWSLWYTLSGHTTPALYDSSRMLIWTPDTCALVVDEMLGDLIGGNSQFSTGQECFIETVELNRNPHTSARIRCMRKQDLYYLGESSYFESDETRITGRGQ